MDNLITIEMEILYLQLSTEIKKEESIDIADVILDKQDIIACMTEAFTVYNKKITGKKLEAVINFWYNREF